MAAGKSVIRIPLERGCAELDTRSAVLRFLNSEDECFYHLKLAPHIEYMEKEAGKASVRFVKRGRDGHFVFESADRFTRMEIHLSLGECVIDYWVVGHAIEPGVDIRCMHYGQDGPGHADASAHRFEEFFIICPDRYGSAIPLKAGMCFKLGVPSFRFDKENNFPHEGGRTIIPPYVAALRSCDDWLGIGTLEIPSSEYGLNMTFQDGRAVIDFHYGGVLKITDSFTFPKVTFFTKHDKHAACRAYIDRLYDDGLAVPNDLWQDAWSGPIYCFFSDQMYEYQVNRASEKWGGEIQMAADYCNDAFLETCLDFLAEKAIPYRTIILDYGWFVTHGEWRPNTKRFKDLRATVRRLHEMGKKVLIWYSPYFISEQASHYKAHPEVAVRGRDGKPVFVVRLGSEVNYMCDFTHPVMRDIVRKDFEFILGRDGLDADGLKIDTTHQPPPIGSLFHDPSWGTGEKFHYRVAKFMFDEAKRIKPGCCVNTTSGNPFFNRTYDLHRIHDVMEYNLDGYEERAWAAWFCRAGVSDLDDWPSFDLFTVRANLRKIAYGVPSLYAVRKRGGERKPGCTTGHTLTVSDNELELLSAIYELYVKVPVDLTQEVFIDPFRKVFHRRYTRGRLKGFFAATTLSGNQAVAVYDEKAAYVVSISDGALSVPLPPGSSGIVLNVVKRGGGRSRTADFELVDGEVVFEAKRSSGDVRRYEISYSLGR